MTPKQSEYLSVIRAYIAKHGYAPTYQELAKLLGIRSLATVFRMLERLEEHGYIIRGATNKARSIELAPEREYPDLRTCALNHPQIWFRVKECPMRSRTFDVTALRSS